MKQLLVAMADTMIVEGDDTVKETGTEMRRQEDKVRQNHLRPRVGRRALAYW